MQDDNALCNSNVKLEGDEVWSIRYRWRSRASERRRNITANSAEVGTVYRPWRAPCLVEGFMTESELREKIAGLVENESSEAHLRSKNWRRLRRVRDIQKSDGLLHTGKYIKYPKNSRSQSWIKLETSRRIRSCRNAPAKGNFYRRLFDYIVMTNCQLSLAKGCKVEKKLWVQRKTVYYCKIVLQYAENGLEVVLTFRDDLFSCLQRLCGCAYILGQTTGKLNLNDNEWRDLSIIFL